MCYGAADAVGSITFGSIVRAIGRVPIFIFAAALNLGLIIALFLWRPDPSEPVVFFVLAALWGLADSIWQTQINCKYCDPSAVGRIVILFFPFLPTAFYGVIFPAEEEAAFSNYRLWESLGFAIAFAYSKGLCANAKLYVLLGVLISGMIGYLIIEFKERKTKKLQINK